MSAGGQREGDGAHAIVTPGTRYVVSLGKDEVAQLAVAGSLCLAAPRFIAMPDPVFVTGIDFASSEDDYAESVWGASLRSPSEVADK